MPFTINVRVDEGPIDAADSDISAAFDSTGNNLIVVAGFGWRAAADFQVPAGGVTDSNGNLYIVLSSPAPASGNVTCFIAYVANPVVGAGHTVTVDPTGTLNYFSYTILGVSGIVAGLPLREFASNQEDILTVGAESGSTTGLSLLDDLAVAVYTPVVPANPFTMTVEAGWTEELAHVDNVNHQAGEVDSQAAPAGGVQQCTWVTTASQYSAMIVVFAAEGEEVGAELTWVPRTPGFWERIPPPPWYPRRRFPY